MHIPDGFLSTPVWLGLGAVSAPAVGWLARRAQPAGEEGRAPLLGVMGAFVFAAQMINFPVGPGTSGHLLGSALMACTLGPSAAAVVMTAILAIQALVFQDGGLLALGANVFNMALAGVLAGYLPYHYLGSGHWRKPALFLGGFLAVMIGALLAMAELLLSGVRIPGGLLTASTALFAVNAALEGAITVAVVQALEAINPGWIQAPPASRRPVLGSLALAAVLLAAVGVLLASAWPDGLEKLAERAGFADTAKALVATPLADYEVRLLGSGWPAKALAGLAGLALVYALCLLASRGLGRKRSA